MPWREASPMDQRTQFIADHLRNTLSITELCELYGVSRKTGYKWIERYVRQGPSGLEERSRRPHRSPNQTAAETCPRGSAPTMACPLPPPPWPGSPSSRRGGCASAPSRSSSSPAAPTRTGGMNGCIAL